MRRIVLGLGGFAAACFVLLVAFLGIVGRLTSENHWFGMIDSSATEKEIEESQRMEQVANALMVSCQPLAAAVLLAVVAILAVLAVRWELRRARAR
jgi:ABC-type Fe3+ transport system permease subunit